MTRLIWGLITFAVLGGGILGTRAVYGEWPEKWWGMLVIAVFFGMANLIGFIEGMMR